MVSLLSFEDLKIVLNTRYKEDLTIELTTYDALYIGMRTSS